MKNGKSIVAIAIAAIMVISVMSVIVSTTVAQHEEEAVNTLRVYGRCTENAAFPYTDYQGPLSIQSSENPPKDFIVWNPAFMYHLDHNANGKYGDFFQSIVVNGLDANEKVHLRQWYVPKYDEPSGTVFADQSPVSSPDIVKEYTYLLLDTNNNPVAGSPGTTSFVFPIADNDDSQIGLDDYDMNGDGVADIVYLETVTDPDMTAMTGDEWIDISTGMFSVSEGDVIRFLDHKAVITGVSVTGITADIYYSGNSNDVSKKSILINTGDTASAGRHLVHVETLTTSPALVPPSQSAQFIAGTSSLQLVIEPWYLQVAASSATSAQIIVGRLLGDGILPGATLPGTATPDRGQETFFVDGAEYEIAAIYAPQPAIPTVNPPMKYITIRNSLPKYDDVILEALTIEKKAVQEKEPLPLLPPFNMEHDMIDDTNIPDCVQGDPNACVYPDEQLPDNVIGEPDLFECLTGAGSPDGYGDISGIDMDYNTIAERRIEDVDPIVETFIAEDKEERFDTNLLEEKFNETCEGEEEWMWKNIETLPWDYTEFVLPELPDITDLVNNDDGDYILVSSFITEDSTIKPIRMKFVYDPTDGTGIYVNTIGVVPTKVLTSVTLDPAGPLTLNVDDTQQFTATAHYSDSSTADVTISATWDSSNTTVGTIIATGLFTAIENGTTAVTATYTYSGVTKTDTAVVEVIPISELPGDANGDCKVDYLDLGILGATYGKSSGEAGYDARADFNHDDTVNYLDLGMLGAHYGETC